VGAALYMISAAAVGWWAGSAESKISALGKEPVE
jgi:hypothetical protein